MNKKVNNIFRTNSKRFAKLDYDLVISDLSGNAFKILAYMLSKPQGWDFRQDKIAEETQFTLHAVRKGTTELQEKGYLIISKYRNNEGRGFSTQYWVYESPNLNKKFLEEQQIVNTEYIQ